VDRFTRLKVSTVLFFPPIGATAPIWALAYLHETLRNGIIASRIMNRDVRKKNTCC
jgi:hypothetical protein